MRYLKHVLLGSFFVSSLVVAQQTAVPPVRVESFSPQGEVKGVRQVVARFSEPMVAFGDPRLESPFNVDCEGKGRGRWADARNWIYDFEADLPAGLKCTFTAKDGVKSQAGAPLGKVSYGFSTGGPAIKVSMPDEGSEIDEEQVFLLGLDAPADMKSVKERASCSIEGVGERIPLEIVEGDQREKIIAEQKDRARNFFLTLSKRGKLGVLAVKDKRMEDATVVVARCGRKLPAGAKVNLLWGAGIKTASGIPTKENQTLPFRVREAFTMTQNCERMNPNAGCVPVLPIALYFTAPVPKELADKIVLRTADGKSVSPTKDKDQSKDEVKSVESVRFDGPNGVFAAKTEVTIELPSKFRDDAGRELENAKSFPLKVRIDDDPPLIKFPSRFGILEQNAQPMLPVSVRNVEATLKGMQGSYGGAAKSKNEAANPANEGALARIDTDDDAQLADWIHRVMTPPHETQSVVNRFEKEKGHWPREGEIPLLFGRAKNDKLFHSSPLSLPRAEGDRTFELIGIPLQKPGFYVVSSPATGWALRCMARRNRITPIRVRWLRIWRCI